MTPFPDDDRDSYPPGERLPHPNDGREGQSPRGGEEIRYRGEHADRYIERIERGQIDDEERFRE